MYATVRTYSASPDLAADGAVSVSIYDNEAGANESTNAAATWIRDNLPEISGSTPQVSAGEVVISA